MRLTYLIVTGLIALFLVGTGAMDISHNPQMVAGVGSLGFPEYFLTIDGVAKILAALAISVPQLRAVREWAYAGLTFLTLGAAWSHLVNHQSPAMPLVILVLVQLSRWGSLRASAA